MVWIDSENELWASSGTEVVGLGNITGLGSFTLIGDNVLWSNGLNGGIKTVAGKTLYSLTSCPPIFGRRRCRSRHLWQRGLCMNLETGKEMIIGFGGLP